MIYDFNTLPHQQIFIELSIFVNFFLSVHSLSLPYVWSIFYAIFTLNFNFWDEVNIINYLFPLFMYVYSIPFPSMCVINI